MPPQKPKKTPAEIQARIDKKKAAVPTISQDQYGYVSGALQYMRDNRDKLSPEQRVQLDAIERSREAHYDDVVNVMIPDYLQPNGEHIPAYRLNNPGNLKDPKTGKFIKFDNPIRGVQALEQQIRLDSARQLTVEEFVYKYAPPSDNNDTELYIRQLTRSNGVDRNSMVRQVPLAQLTNFILHKESGSKVERESQSNFRGRGAGARF